MKEDYSQRCLSSKVSTHKNKTKSVQGFVQREEGCLGVFNTSSTLQSGSVESNVPVGQIRDEIQQSWNDSVQTVR